MGKKGKKIMETSRTSKNGSTIRRLTPRSTGVIRRSQGNFSTILTRKPDCYLFIFIFSYSHVFGPEIIRASKPTKHFRILIFLV